MINKSDMQRVIDLAHVFKNENKTIIIDQLKQEPGTAHQLHERTSLNMNYLMTYLSLMKKSGIIIAKKYDRRSVYYLNEKLYTEFQSFIQTLKNESHD